MWPAVVCRGMPNRTTNGPDTQPDDIKVNWLVPVLSVSLLLFILLSFFFSLCLVSFPVSILALFKSLSICVLKSTFSCYYFVSSCLCLPSHYSLILHHSLIPLHTFCMHYTLLTSSLQVCPHQVVPLLFHLWFS